MDEHDPQSALECELVERLAGILWRLRRVPFFEAAILSARHVEVRDRQFLNYLALRETKEEEVEDWKASVHFGQALIEDASWNDALGKLARYETTLMNAFTKTLQTLLLLQENRTNTKSEPVILEAVTLPPAA